MSLTIYELQGTLTDEDLITLIKLRLPVTEHEIKIVNTKVKQNVFLDVAFYYELGLKYPEVLYTHLYHGELLDYVESSRK